MKLFRISIGLSLLIFTLLWWHYSAQLKSKYDVYSLGAFDVSIVSNWIEVNKPSLTEINPYALALDAGVPPQRCESIKVGVINSSVKPVFWVASDFRLQDSYIVTWRGSGRRWTCVSKALFDQITSAKNAATFELRMNEQAYNSTCELLEAMENDKKKK